MIGDGAVRAALKAVMSFIPASIHPHARVHAKVAHQPKQINLYRAMFLECCVNKTILKPFLLKEITMQYLCDARYSCAHEGILFLAKINITATTFNS